MQHGRVTGQPAQRAEGPGSSGTFDAGRWTTPCRIVDA
ncbi:hypothetical protein DVS28_a1552 [Euzebya pacifica]|uniref:Uncharacterized protein n=1 Tax=Euzebya pacifica TaxID=1608957 RepID=A0A346XVJ8_9ACTN|nr:hypothetical protein DVS28_a1552 [Euzebya pacifica]